MAQLQIKHCRVHNAKAECRTNFKRVAIAAANGTAAATEAAEAVGKRMMDAHQFTRPHMPTDATVIYKGKEGIIVTARHSSSHMFT